jgi:hypothetical protein
MSEHPIRLAVGDDLRRSRLTVLVRALLAYPHFWWSGIWFFAVVFATIAQ